MAMTVNIPRPTLTLRRKPYGKLTHFLDGRKLANVGYYRVLYIYTASCQGELSKTQKDQLKTWIQINKLKEGGESQMLEKWGFTREEYAVLLGKLL